MRKNLYRLSLACLMSLLISQITFAQGGFGEADANSDNKVDIEELEAYVSGKLSDFDRFDELMTELDTDQDGSISNDEFDNRMAAVQKVKNSPVPKTEKPKTEKPKTEKPEEVEFVDRYEKKFAARDPKLGQTMPDASAFDENGNPFELNQTRGKYTVIVFGCLT